LECSPARRVVADDSRPDSPLPGFDAAARAAGIRREPAPPLRFFTDSS
jgi:hypothetical protein